MEKFAVGDEVRFRNPEQLKMTKLKDAGEEVLNGKHKVLRVELIADKCDCGLREHPHTKWCAINPYYHANHPQLLVTTADPNGEWGGTWFTHV